MIKHTIIFVVVLAAVWIVLTETISVLTISVGFFIGTASIIFWYRSLPTKAKNEIKVRGLILYPFYLIIQIYIAGLAAIKLVIFGAKTETVVVKTRITCRALRVVLANSVTLIPGSVSIGLTDDKLSVIWLRDKSAPIATEEEANKALISGLEKVLLRAQK